MKKILILLFISNVCFTQTLIKEKIDLNNQLNITRGIINNSNWIPVEYNRYWTGVLQVQEDTMYKEGLPAKIKVNDEYQYTMIRSVTRDDLGSNYIFLVDLVPESITEFYIGDIDNIQMIERNIKDEEEYILPADWHLVRVKEKPSSIDSLLLYGAPPDIERLIDSLNNIEAIDIEFEIDKNKTEPNMNNVMLKIVKPFQLREGIKVIESPQSEAIKVNLWFVKE